MCVCVCVCVCVCACVCVCVCLAHKRQYRSHDHDAVESEFGTQAGTNRSDFTNASETGFCSCRPSLPPWDGGVRGGGGAGRGGAGVGTG